MGGGLPLPGSKLKQNLRFPLLPALTGANSALERAAAHLRASSGMMSSVQIGFGVLCNTGPGPPSVWADSPPEKTGAGCTCSPPRTNDHAIPNPSGAYGRGLYLQPAANTRRL